MTKSISNILDWARLPFSETKKTGVSVNQNLLEPSRIPHIITLLGLVSILYGEITAEQSKYVTVLFIFLVIVLLFKKEKILSPILEEILSLTTGGLVIIYELITRRDILVLGITHFLMAIQLVKLIKSKTKRDANQLLLLSLLQFFVSATLTEEKGFLLILILYIFFAGIYLQSLQLSWRGDALPEKGKSRKVFISYTFLPATIMIGMALFMILPRFKAELFTPWHLDWRNIQGFSRNFRLGDLRGVLENERVFMRVVTDNPQKWRGAVYNLYRNGRWLAVNRIISGGKPSTDNQTILNPDLVTRKNLLRQEFAIERYNLHVIFAAYRPAKISLDYTEVRTDNREELYSVSPLKNGAHYTVWSVVEHPNPVLLRNSIPDYTQDIIRNFVAPTYSIPERVRELAKQITKDSDNVYDKCVVLSKYLKNNYTYSLQFRRDYQYDPVEDFLFNQRKGQCEYFASAMAVLARAIGIPSRIISGFQPGEYNDLGDYYVVKEKHAHSWVEIFFNNYGWVEFDPTPRADSLSTGTGLFAAIANFTDLLEVRWRRYFVDFTTESQLEIFASITNSVRKIAITMKNSMVYSALLITILVGCFALALFAFLSRLLKKPGFKTKVFPMFSRRRPGLYKHSSNIPVVSAYIKMLEMLSRKGWEKPTHYTPLEYKHFLEKQNIPGFEQIAHITDRIISTRYAESSQSCSTEELNRELKQLAHHLKS